jgi:hypothetical protein
VEEEILFSRDLKTTDTADDIFEVVSKFFETNELNWKILVGVALMELQHRWDHD